MALRFVAGETLEGAIEAVRSINGRGMTATLDHLGENISNPAEAQEAADACCRSLDAIHEGGLQCSLSVKLTQLGLDIGRECAAENLVRVLEHAQQSNTFVRIDMEGSEYVDRTLSLFGEVRERFDNVGTVIQSYLYRSERDVRRLVESGASIRLVKGAYLEPETVAYPRKVDVDANYVRLMRVLLDAGHYPAIATHDPAMIDATRRYAAAQDIDSSAFEFQMLYGIRRDLQEVLVASGYRMRIYVPYGTQWYPYFMRRLAERPANVMFVLGNIAREASRGRGG
jgi:proline dehydrogenase